MQIYSYDEILNLEKYYRINLLNKISGIKSAHLIGTKNLEGQTNLAVFNSVVHIGANPPYLGFILRPLTVARHTYENIKATGFFTINQITEDIHKKAHLTSAKFPKEVSEFEACNLTEQYINDFPIPFVGESKIQIGLSFQEENLIKANNTILVIGKIETLILPKDVIGSDGDLNLEDVNGVGIGGLNSYYTCKRIGDYKYARVNTKIEEM